VHARVEITDDTPAIPGDPDHPTGEVFAPAVDDPDDAAFQRGRNDRVQGDFRACLGAEARHDHFEEGKAGRQPARTLKK
jgi:hypothetical protein